MAIQSVSVVIPVYQSEKMLTELVDRIMKALATASFNYEVILVEDGGKDGSWELIQELATKNSQVRGVKLGRNYGQHNALLCGIRASGNEVIVTLDDDLQNPPEEILKLLARLDEGYDVVYGTPQTKQHGFWRRLSSKMIIHTLQKAMGAEAARNMSSFRAFRTELREAFSNFHSPFVSIDALLTWATDRFSSVAVVHESRKTGLSNYTFKMLVVHAMNVITGFSTIPLRLASFLGFAMTLFGLAVLAYVVGRYLITGHSFPGFPFLASVISLFSGTQLFTLGIIGEYLARMHERLMEKPPYTVRATTF